MKPLRNVIVNKGTVGGLVNGIGLTLLALGVSISACSPDKKTAGKGTIGQKAPASESQAESSAEPKPFAHSEPKTPVASEVVTGMATGFSSKLVTFPEPNAYRVHLKANSKSDFRGFYKIFRSADPNKDFAELVTLNWDQPELIQSTFVDKSREKEAQTWELVEPGKSYYYRVQMMDSVVGTQNLTDEAMGIHFPKDFVFNEGVTRSPGAELTGFSRVFLSKGARVRVEDQKLLIVADEVIALGGQIETFQVTDHAEKGAAGRDGGLIQIQAKKVIGKLKITAHGEKGGQGEGGTVGKSGADGKDGRPGRWGQNSHTTPRQVHCADYQSGSLYGCERPGDGENGVNGGNGTDGKRGLQGGNSGRVLVKIDDVSEGSVQVETQAGLGGAGGIPGGKGKGGNPGLMGSYYPLVDGFNPVMAGYCRCDGASEPKHGTRGSDGAQGEAGPSGDPGRVLEGCLLLGEKKIGCTGEVIWTAF